VQTVAEFKLFMHFMRHSLDFPVYPLDRQRSSGCCPHTYMYSATAQSRSSEPYVVPSTGTIFLWNYCFSSSTFLFHSLSRKHLD